METDNGISSRLKIAMPFTGSGLNIHLDGMRVTEADDSLERLLRNRSPEDGFRALRGNGESPPAEGTRLLLRLFMETRRAILTQRSIEFHTLRGAIRTGRTTGVECALFRDLIRPSEKV
ncbi:hypothetical protein HZA43_04145 [Candidatus Peregrinibacteria bacterium]|nr:hypothetical protein [Candidatus Peregrinibacteria bacterium]